MKIIIPAAGAGTRLRPLTYTQPKLLINVAGKPILDHILKSILPLRPSEVIFVVGDGGERIARYFKQNYNLKASFIRQEKALGLGHAVHLAMVEISSGPVLIVLGDTILDARFLKRIPRQIDWLGVKEVPDPERFGIAETKQGWVTRLVEKPHRPKNNLALIGLYYIKSSPVFKQCLEEVTRKGWMTKNEYQLTDALQLAIERGIKFKAVPVKNWYDCGKIETLLETNRRLLSENSPSIPRLDDSVVLPPVYLSRKASIEHSVVGPYVTVLDRAVVNHSIVRNSILLEGSRVKQAIVEETVVGQNTRAEGKFNNVVLADRKKVAI